MFILKSKINFPVVDLTFGCIPNYGGMVRIEDKIKENRYKVFEIQFYVSFIGNYFNIQIAEIDETYELSEKLMQYLTSQKLVNLIVSPTNDKYGAIFSEIESFLNLRFNNLKFIPYSIDKTVLNGLIVPHTIKIRNTIGDALFCKKVPANVPDSISGDVNYGIEGLE